MHTRPILACLLVILLLGTCSWPAMVQVAAPPLRYADDSRSAFSWAPQPPSFPSSATTQVRVVDRHRPNPNPWEVAWVVLGDEQRFIAFVPKPTGWHIEVWDAEATPPQRYVASGPSPTYLPGQPVTVSVTARDNGIEVIADSRRNRDGRTETIRLATLVGWTQERPPPAWWREPMKAGVYVEDCTAELEWIDSL